MGRDVIKRARRACWIVLLLLVWLTLARADEVRLRDGERIAGTVLTLDEVELVILADDGKRRRIQRDRIATIRLDAPKPRPVVRVEVKVLEADDSLSLWFNGREVVSRTPKGREWIDVTDLVRDGTNEIRATVHNATAFWGYRWGVRAAGQTSLFECGEIRRSGCAEEGRDPLASGDIELEPVWLYYDEDEGTVEVER